MNPFKWRLRCAFHLWRGCYDWRTAWYAAKQFDSGIVMSPREAAAEELSYAAQDIDP